MLDVDWRVEDVGQHLENAGVGGGASGGQDPGVRLEGMSELLGVDSQSHELAFDAGSNVDFLRESADSSVQVVEAEVAGDYRVDFFLVEVESDVSEVASRRRLEQFTEQSPVTFRTFPANSFSRQRTVFETDQSHEVLLVDGIAQNVTVQIRSRVLENQEDGVARSQTHGHVAFAKTHPN